MKTKTFAVILTIVFATLNLYSQFNCEFYPASNMPPAAITDGQMIFDGKGDYLISQDDPRLDLEYTQTDSFTIETRIKITSLFKPMKIIGKLFGSGWMISYHTHQGGYLTFLIGNSLANFYLLGADTNWHTYKITYSKQSLTLTTIVDNNITGTFNNFIYSNTANDAAFSIGNVGFGPTFGFYTVTVYDNWFKGGIDFLKLNTNNTHLLNYNFNEGAGQFIRDSASYNITDRILPGVPLYCGALHLMAGFMPSVDTCDPAWTAGTSSSITDFHPLDEGLSYYFESGPMSSFVESFSLGLTVWNGKLVNGGRFNRAGNIQAEHIAMWNGSQWFPVGSGLNHEAVCLTTYNGELYAGGFFDTAYGFGETRHIARWDGSRWRNLGNGTSDLVTVMKEFNGELIVGGYFMSVGEIYAPHIAKWNGSSWSSMGFGMTGAVWALEEYKGELYAGGNFIFAGTQECYGIAKWNGTDWRPVGAGIHGAEEIIFTLYEYNNELWAGGAFITMNGITANNIAKFNGVSWSAIGTGAGNLSCFPSGAHVIDMQQYGTSLFVIGQFTEIDGVRANKIARYEHGGFWCPVEFGADLRPEELEVYNGELIINGDFYSISGKPLSNIARYHPENFLGTNQTNNLPGKFLLMQNYPNPFNPVTKIKYQIINYKEQLRSKIKIAVFDVTGKEIKVLVNEEQNSGTYEITFNGSNLASGVYYYKLIAGDASNSIIFSETRKMVLVK